MKGKSVSALLATLDADWRMKGIKSLDTARYHALPVAAHFGQRTASTVTPRDLREYVVKRQGEGKANDTIRTELAILKRAMTLAYQEGELARVPAFPQVPASPARQGVFTLAQAEAVCAELPPHLAAVAWYAYYTGRRKGEILALEWGDVDLEHRMLTVRIVTTKTGDPDRLPLAGPLYDLLMARSRERVEGCPLVFHYRGRPIGKFNETWRLACRRAGCPGKHFHDFRRTAATDLTEAGVPPHVAMRVTGHRSMATFTRYNITKTSTVADAMEKMWGHRRGNA